MDALQARMIVGNRTIFAIESKVTKAYERLSFRGLGFFVIYVNSRCYGVPETDASLLACSFDEVEKRLQRRGEHAAAVLDQVEASDIASAFLETFYGAAPRTTSWGIPPKGFAEMIRGSHVQWAPDGDEAFDDGSYVLQFDVADRVRIIAFKSLPGSGYDPSTLNEALVEAKMFYVTLESWRDRFLAEWAALPKTAE